MAQSVPVEMNASEKALMEKYGFKVSTDVFGHYIVIDPEMKKKNNRYEGGNLHATMLLALDERKRANAPVSKPGPVSNVIKRSFERVVPKEVVEQKLPKAIKHGKLYTIKTMLLDDPNVKVDEILAKLKADGMPASLSTVVTVRTDFFHTINVLKKAGIYIDKS